MRIRMLALLLLNGIASVVRGEIPPSAVAVLCNAAVPESRSLADFYCKARGIPEENVIALTLPTTPIITRSDYNKFLLSPLRNEFEMRGWWRRQRDSNGITLPVVNKIRVMVTMRGVPLKISQSPKPEPKPGETPKPPDPVAGHDQASVDSELAMFGVEGLPVDGVLQNKFHQSQKGISESNLPFLILTSRIDAASLATCERMIRDAVEVEKTGLWGRAYLDIANKFPQGDQWLEAIVKQYRNEGIPTVADRFNDTFPKNYPLTDASLYFGWYDWHVSGPFTNDKFRFRKGAVAMHLHSFSADQLTNATQNWCAPLLEKGAAATVGNVYEPYLHLTHDFGMLSDRLLAGHSWVEACWMAVPVTSWQGVVIGDPLYRPFRHFSGTGIKLDTDVEYRALRAAGIEWKTNLVERQNQIEKAVERMKSGTYAESAGLEYIERKEPVKAAEWFKVAKTYFVQPEDRLRQVIHLAAIERSANRKDDAVRILKTAAAEYGSIPEALALRGWLDILDPPPPSRADPTKSPAIK